MDNKCVNSIYLLYLNYMPNVSGLDNYYFFSYIWVNSSAAISFGRICRSLTAGLEECIVGEKFII